jgi:cellulose synthase/poly-beta-1,6-N-acetylglucosamine synthase-like glycosyltransferase
MKKLPKVSVIIPLRKLSYYLLFENLPEMAKQTYRKFEVIVLPNEHGQYDLTLLKQYKWLRIIPTGKITRPAEKRDIGVKNAKGEIIAFIDDDAYPDPNWITSAVSFFASKKAAVVCGPGVLPKRTNGWEQIFDEVLKSPIGSGGYEYRFTRRRARYVDDYPSMNFFIRKKLFQKLGGFNSDYWPGEDSKLCNDIIVKERGKIYYHPDVLVYHHRRGDFGGYLKQHANYGFHRGAFFAHGDKNSRNVVYIVPTMFVIYLITLPLTYLLLARISLLPLGLYGILLSYLVLRTFVNTLSAPVALGSALVLVSTHLIYGINFVKGFLKGINKSASIYGKKTD